MFDFHTAKVEFVNIDNSAYNFRSSNVYHVYSGIYGNSWEKPVSVH